MVKVYKYECLKCKDFFQFLDVKIFFNQGCPSCGSKEIKLMGYSEEDLK